MTEVAGLNVSRETFDKLRAFANLVEKWTIKINLISKPSIPTIWDRHIVDSAQIFNAAPSSGHWVDLGSGGGFPGVVVGILTQGTATPHQITLVESDQRKSVFLRTAARELDLDVCVRSERIEAIDALNADVLSARALSDLKTLLSFANRHMNVGGTALFPKGAQWQKEDQDARETWSYACEVIRSITNAEAAILKIKDISLV